MAKQSFENAMQKLEEITKELEVGELSLEKALQRFEEGVKLSKFCGEKLEETEKRVTILLKGMDGDIHEKPFLTENNT